MRSIAEVMEPYIEEQNNKKKQKQKQKKKLAEMQKQEQIQKNMESVPELDLENTHEENSFVDSVS